MRRLFKEDHVLVLDPDTFKEMLTSGKTTYGIDYSISLDTMAFSHLAKSINTRGEKAPRDFREVFEFLARDDVWVDGMPYLMENFIRVELLDGKRSEHVFESIKAFEVLRTHRSRSSAKDRFCSLTPRGRQLDEASAGKHGQLLL